MWLQEATLGRDPALDNKANQIPPPNNEFLKEVRSLVGLLRRRNPPCSTKPHLLIAPF